ncbi:MAG TPA: hypothetical protein PLU43_05865, partial [Lachnospiraceae bacterium]|nr:hypothetical protein [Lachnospiraceae bacterium]
MSIHNKKSNPTSRKKIFWSSAALILLLIGILFSTFSKALPYLSEDNSYTADYAVSGEIYSFRKQAYLIEHYNDHGDEFDYTSAAEYLDGANRVISSPDALHKLEAEDGDDVYYLE